MTGRSATCRYQAKGLYIIHQTGLGSPEDGFIRLLPADGRWTWVSDEVVYPSYYPSDLAVYKQSAVDRVDGYDDSRLVPFTWAGPPPTPSVPNPSWIHFRRDRQTNQLIEQTTFRGEGRDAWSLTNNLFTPWSNPNSQNQAKQRTWVGIEIINEVGAFGASVLNVYIDSVACLALPPSKPQDLRISLVQIGYGYARPKLTWAQVEEPDVYDGGSILIYRRIKQGSPYWGQWTYLDQVNGNETEFIDGRFQPQERETTLCSTQSNRKTTPRTSSRYFRMLFR